MIYKNIYILKYKKLPLYLFKGNETLFYTDNVKYVKNIPKEYNNKLDLLIDCDCQFAKYRKIEKIFK